MTVIRQYGNLIINLTKVLFIEQCNTAIKIVCPLTNQYAGSSTWTSDITNTYKVQFTSKEAARNELESIRKALETHYECRN